MIIRKRELDGLIHRINELEERLDECLYKRFRLPDDSLITISLVDRVEDIEDEILELAKYLGIHKETIPAMPATQESFRYVKNNKKGK